MLAIAPLWLTMDGSNVSRAPRVGHKKSRKGCAQCKRRHVKVCFPPVLYISPQEPVILTRFRIRSATKKHRALIASDTVSRALSLVGPTSQETMRSPNNEVQQRRCRACLPGTPHTMQPEQVRALRREHEQRARVQAPEIHKSTTPSGY